ncbi:MAG: homoserine kinase [Bacillota bacterium]|nr:homoserine kinase [Bacillota bacterium]
MTSKDHWMIKVPASTANLGPGFDSVGLAVNLYLTIEVELSHEWQFIAATSDLIKFPSNDQHFICQVAKQIAGRKNKVLSPCKVTVSSEIPLARGLGSSAAAIVAGIELADLIGNLELTKHEKLLFATEFEGHPDNVGASLFGGLVIGSCFENQVEMISYPNLSFEVVVVIPQEELLTKVAREVLPNVLHYHEAVQASSAANLLIAALLTKNWKLAGKMMEQDLFHQPYRKPLIPYYSEIETSAKEYGAFGVALSGAGPTLICFTEKRNGAKLSSALQQEFPLMEVKQLSIETKGSNVWKKETCRN